MAETIAMPKLGFDMAEGTLVRWMIAENEQVNKGQVLAEIETDKATVEVESSATGVVLRHLVEEGEVVPVGTPIAIVGEPGEEIPEAAQPQSPEEASIEKPAPKKEVEVEKERPADDTAVPEPESGEDGRLKASPIARRMAEENELDLSMVVGTGPGGRIVKRDVENALKGALKPKAAEAQPKVEMPAEPKPGILPVITWVPGASVPADEHIELDRLRTIIAKRMLESKTQLPHFYITSEYEAGPLVELRAQINQQLPDENKLSLNDFVIKAVALALRQVPNLNASLEGMKITRHGHINIGVAVALESGLMTIVCKDADQKPIRLISQEVREMAGRARQGKVRPEDIEGSTFSISNLGMFDVDHFIAIINPPEAGILAVGSVKEAPVVVNGQVQVGTRMKATISADHRVTDGAEAARFMQVLGEFIENPLRLLL